MTVKTTVKNTLLIRKSNGQTVKKENTSEIGITRSILTETKLGNVNRLAKQARSVKIGVGFPNITHPNSGSKNGRSLTFAELAVILEYGTKNSVGRPYLRKSGEIIAPKLVSEISLAMQRITNSPKPLTKDEIARNFQPVANNAAKRTKRIIETKGARVAPNKPSTLKQKSPEKRPWIKTRKLINSIVGTAYISSK